MRPAAHFWNRFARRHAASPIRDPAAFQAKIGTITGCLGPGMDVLDMACGTGTMAIRIAPHVRHVHAIDISPRMIDIARTRAAEAGTDNITFEVAAIEDLDATHPLYDAVLALAVLHLLDDWRGAIAKAHDLLKPGGVFISSTHCIEGERKRLKFLVRLGVPLGLMPNLQLIARDDLRAAILAAGFRIERESPPPQNPAMIVARKPPDAPA